MFVGYVGMEDREKKKVAEEKCTRVMTGFRWREGCVGWAENMAKESCTWTVTGFRWREGRMGWAEDMSQEHCTWVLITFDEENKGRFISLVWADDRKLICGASPCFTNFSLKTL